ncbi:glycosyltransferase involved in cell wall biosynthesis [Fontibacillus solani]|uniref:Glycosyltransferase involved in cell wall biosynthesis n=1 Tax=Fontibacillus solani TaxID=1572857 RepID=A0A7W3SQV6_9BACL|nr:glycosyltransferase family 4 protein [Fontibacillus solani]MBA9084536.1 glycosyltransferase involved in cell wall biosynthesis [Fontibacillus solani]
MKILLTTYFYLPHVGGLSTYVDVLRKELEAMGHHVDVFAHHPDMKKYYMLNNGRYLDKAKLKDPIYDKIYGYYDTNMKHVDPWIRWRDIERYCFEAAAAAFDLTKYDLIHTQDIVSTRALWRVKPKSTPLIATIHGCLAEEFLYTGEITGKETLKWKYIAAEEFYGAVSSDMTIVPTQWLKNLLIDEFGVAEHKLKVIPYGIDIKSFKKRLQQHVDLPVKEGHKVFICPARLVTIKGHKYLLDALARLKQVRSDWICFLLGNGPCRNELLVQRQALGLEQHVEFLGDRNDVPAILGRGDIFVLPSIQDNLPFSVMEAQAAGKPIVVSNAGGIPEMVTHEETGLISPVGESEQMFKNLLRLMEDRDLRKRIGEQARRWAIQQWSTHTLMQRTMDVYSSVINQHLVTKGGE